MADFEQDPSAREAYAQMYPLASDKIVSLENDFIAEHEPGHYWGGAFIANPSMVPVLEFGQVADETPPGQEAVLHFLFRSGNTMMSGIIDVFDGVRAQDNITPDGEMTNCNEYEVIMPQDGPPAILRRDDAINVNYQDELMQRIDDGLAHPLSVSRAQAIVHGIQSLEIGMVNIDEYERRRQ